MTEKEIIIDGVNVAECRHYEDVCFYNCNETRTIDGGIVCVKCEETPNCYYKQLKRKEEECDELKKEKQKLITKSLEQKCKIRELINENSTKEVTFKVNGKTTTAKTNRVKQIIDFIENLKQLDQLKAENDDLKKSILQECPNCGEEYLNYKGVELYDENNQLKQTLAEIKEIAQGYKPYKVCGDYNNNCEPINEILQKCEVIKAKNENEPKR